MGDVAEQNLLEAVVDSWERNNRVLVNLLRLVPEGGMEARAMGGSPTVGEIFAHIHYGRLIVIEEDAPEFARPVPKEEWVAEKDVERMAAMLQESAQAVRDALQNKLETGGAMRLHYDHPLLLLQHMIWHEGYHHGQIKLVLKLAGKPIRDEEAGPGTWRVWMSKTK